MQSKNRVTLTVVVLSAIVLAVMPGAARLARADDAEVAELRAKVADLAARNAALLSELAELRQENARLLEQLAAAESGNATPMVSPPKGDVRAAMELNLGQEIRLGPVLAFAKEKGFLVEDHGKYLTWRKVNAARDGAYIFGSGRIVIASAKPFTGLEDRDRLASAAVFVTGTIAKVNVDVKPYDEWVMYEPRYYAEKSGVYKAVPILLKDRFADLTIRVEVPKVTVKEARLRVIAANGQETRKWISFDGHPIPQDDSVAKWLRFGTHQITLATRWYGTWLPVSVRLEAFAEPTDEQITAKVGNSIVTEAALTRLVKELDLPAISALSP